MIRQKVKAIEAGNPYGLAKRINEFNETHNTFATQIYPPTHKDEGWTAFIHYREAKE